MPSINGNRIWYFSLFFVMPHKIYHSTKFNRFIDLHIHHQNQPAIQINLCSIMKPTPLKRNPSIRSKDLPKQHWMFSFWSSGPIVTKKIGFSRNFCQLSWALIFFSPPPTHNLWKPIAWTVHWMVWVKRVLTVDVRGLASYHAKPHMAFSQVCK